MSWGMAYVALQSYMEVDDLQLTSFTLHSIMASRICVEKQA